MRVAVEKSFTWFDSKHDVGGVSVGDQGAGSRQREHLSRTKTTAPRPQLRDRSDERSIFREATGARRVRGNGGRLCGKVVLEWFHNSEKTMEIYCEESIRSFDCTVLVGRINDKQT